MSDETPKLKPCSTALPSGSSPSASAQGFRSTSLPVLLGTNQRGPKTSSPMGSTRRGYPTPRSGRLWTGSKCLRHKKLLHQNPVQCLTARCWAGNKPQLFFCRDNRQRSSCSMDVLSRQHIFHGVDGNLVFLNEPGKSTRASPEDCYVVAKVKLARPGQSAFIAFSEQIIS